MPKLEILENKKLVLKNVLIKELRNIKIDDLEKELKDFEKSLDLLKVQIFGPLIIKTGGAYIGEDGVMTVDYEFFAQAHDFRQYKNTFLIKERFECPYCAYIRFEGSPSDIHYAHSKLELHFYERELESNGEVYSVILEDSEHRMVIDIFKPVVRL